QSVQVDQHDQAAVRRNRHAREELHVAQIFAEILDDDFVLAQNFFDDNSNLPPADIDQHHAIEAVHRLDWRQTQLLVELYHFRYNVADLGKQLAADFLDLRVGDAANLFHERQRERELALTAAHEQRLRDDERQRH